MADDYLWDKSGPPDAEIERLEHLLGTLRSTPAAPEWDRVAVMPPRRSTPAWLAAAAGLILACGASVWPLTVPASPRWPLIEVEGRPTVDRTAAGRDGTLGIGQWLETDASSRATIAVGDIGRLEVEPRTRLQLVETRTGHHRLRLPRGTVQAFIWAPPGQFVVDTPASRAVDLGCAYSLTVDAAGSGRIAVTAGWVAFEKDGRESLIPAGAVCPMHPASGPGTPYFTDASTELQGALALLDSMAPDVATHREAVGRALAAARPRDALSLWHLLARVGPGDRGRVFDALARFVPPPAGVTRAGIIAGDRAMRDAWWDALGFGSSTFWREWTRQWSGTLD